MIQLKWFPPSWLLTTFRGGHIHWSCVHSKQFYEISQKSGFQPLSSSNGWVTEPDLPKAGLILCWLWQMDYWFQGLLLAKKRDPIFIGSMSIPSTSTLIPSVSLATSRWGFSTIFFSTMRPQLYDSFGRTNQLMGCSCFSFACILLYHLYSQGERRSTSTLASYTI